MGFRLKIRNFQAWDETEVEADGLTVVIGPSSQGKSSLFRALKAVVRNQLGAHYLRHGQPDAAEVELSLDGHKVLARRTRKGSTEYVVDGQEYRKLGSAVPTSVTDLGLGEIEIGDISLDPIFARQGERQFLLEESPTVLNTLLGAFASTEKLEGGKREALARMGERNAEARLLSKQMRDNEDVRFNLSPLLEKAESLGVSVARLQREITQTEAVIQAFDQALLSGDRLRRQRSALRSLSIPETEPLSHTLRVTHSLGEAGVSGQRLRMLRATIGKLTVPESNALAPTAEIAHYAATLACAKSLLGCSRAYIAGVSRVIENWELVCSLWSTIKAMTLADRAREARDKSPARMYAHQLDQHLRQAGESRENCLRAAATSETLTVLQAATTRQAAIRKQIQADTRQQNLQAADLERLETAIREERERHIQESMTAHCPACGETFNPNPSSTEENYHAHIIQ